MITEKTIAIYTAFAHKLPNARPELLEVLLENRNRIVVFGLESQSIGENAFREIGIKYCSIPISRHGLRIKDEFNASKVIAREIHKKKIDVLLTYGIRLVPSANSAAKKAKIPVINVVNGAGTLFAENGIKGVLLKKAILPILKLNFYNANIVVFQNKDDLDEFVKIRLVDGDKCKLTNGSGVNLQKYTFTPLPDDVIF